MTGHLGLLPGREAGIEVPQGLGRLDLQAGDLLADGGGAVAGIERAQLLQLGLDLGHRLLKVEITAHRAKNIVPSRGKPKARRAGKLARGDPPVKQG
jgi:hypothetical protein